MPLNTKTITYALVAASSTGIAISQAGTSATPISFNGGLVTNGVATLDSGGASRRVSIFSGGNDTGISFKITGTDRNSLTQSETIAGGSGAAVQSTRDYKTVTSIVPTGNTATYLTAGTNGVGSSDAYIVDWVPNGNLLNCGIILSGTVNCTIQESVDDFAPTWDQIANTFTWFNDATLASISTNTLHTIAGPFTAVRLLINSGTGIATAKFVTPFIGGAI